MKAAIAAVVVSLLAAGSVRASDLLAVYQDALQSDPQIRAADATRKATDEARPQAWAAVFPQITGTASRTRGETDSSSPQFAFDPVTLLPIPVQRQSILRPNSDTWSINLRENVFSWANWTALRRANHTVAQAEADYQAAQQDLMARVAQRYFSVLGAQDTLEANAVSLDAISRQLDQANKRYEVGLIAITDVEDAKSAHDSAAAAVIAAKRALASAQEQLRAVTGQKYDVLAKPGDDMPLRTPNPVDENRWVEVSLDRNATLVSSRLAADIARDDVRSAFGGHLPTLDIVASKTHTDSDASYAFEGTPAFPFNTDTRDREYGLQITVPIFSGGLTQSRVRESQYRWIAAKERVVQASRETERAARDAYLGVNSEIARVQALRQAVASAQTALKATEAGYEVGTRTAVDVLNSRRILVQAQTDYSASRYSYILDLVALRQAAGNLDATTLQEVNQWLNVTAPTSSTEPNADTSPATPQTPQSPGPAPAPAPTQPPPPPRQ